MERIADTERPGVMTRALFKLGERMYGKVPTPERIAKTDRQLRALLNLQVATLYGVPY